MTGIFILKKSYILASLVAPLMVGTFIWGWWIYFSLKPLSDFVALSSIFEIERGEEGPDVVKLRAGHPVTWSQRYGSVLLSAGIDANATYSNLNRRRYAQNDDTLYVAPEDERTDYVRRP
jgi:hypothetical protein